MNIIFEAEPSDIDRRLVEEDALHVLLVDDDRIPSAIQVDSGAFEAATREGIRASVTAWAARLRGGMPDIAYLPALVSYAQGSIAVELARRDVRVVVGTSRERFLALIDDADVAAAIWT